MNDNDLRDQATIADVSHRKLPRVQSDVSCLVMMYGDNLGRRYPIEDTPLIIGRSVHCDICIEDESLSRKHCRVEPGGGEVTLNDLKSTNGTMVNGASVQKIQLRDGDQIQLGRSIFKFLSGDNLENAYHEEIYRLKITDGLTGAYNRRFFNQELDREYYRAARYKRPLALILMDIDRFKQINDRRGHLAGDFVLAQLGSLVAAEVRREDLFCRYGGEEFAILAPEMELAKAGDLADRVRRLIEEREFAYEGTNIQVTVSFGVAEASEAEGGSQELVRVADERMFTAKASGRNRVVLSTND